MLQWVIINTPETPANLEAQPRSGRYKEEQNGNFRTKRYNNQNNRFSGWAQQQNREDKGKNR